MNEINTSIFKNKIDDRRHDLSRIDLLRDNVGNIGPVVSKQSQETAITVKDTSLGFNFLQFIIIVVSCILVLGLVLGVITFRRRRRSQCNLRGIPSILLESASGLATMQERISIESTRSKVPVPYYILPPSPEYDSIFIDSSGKTMTKELSKPKSALTIESCQSQESLSRFL